MNSAMKKVNIVLTVVVIAVAVVLLSMITMLIVGNLTSKADVRDEGLVASQSPLGRGDEPAAASKAETADGAEDSAAAAGGTADDDGGADGPGDDDAIGLVGGETMAAGDGDSEAGDAEGETPPDDVDSGAADAAAYDADDTADTADDADAEPDAAGINTEPVRDDGIQEAIETAAKKHGAAGVQVAVISNGEVVGSYVYGDAVKGASPMAANTKIRIASISKVVLSMLIMRLCELGQLDIDADVSDYWGAPVRNPSHADTPITMRQIMSHTSSMIVYDYGFAAGGELVRQRFLDGSCFGNRSPGAIGSWNYNNYAFAALGLTVEVATGETVNDLAARYLFGPLGIDAAFGSGSINDTGNLATLYTNGGGVGRSAETQRSTFGSTFPGERGEEFPGGLTISAGDLAKLIAALTGDGQYRGTRLLSPESVALMKSSQGQTGGFDQCLPLRRRANLYGEELLYYHTGSNYGAYNLVSFNPVSADGVVVLTSGASGTTDSYGIYAICSEISEYIYRNM